MRCALVFCFVASGFFGTAAAQGTPDRTRPADRSSDAYERALQDMLADPGDIEKTFRYATIAAERNDLEGAISAFSRLLITNPELWQVHYQLGILYFRLKSYALAKSYFQGAASMQDVPSATQDRIAGYIEEIDAKIATNRFSGNVAVGVRYQTNANGASGVVPSQANVAGLQDQFSRKEDFDIFGNLQVKHVYDFNTVDGTTLETAFQGYGAKQSSEEDFDLLYFDLASGPRFVVPPDWMEGLSVRPYLQLTYVHLGNARLNTAVGGGLELKKEISETANASLGYSVQDFSYHNTALRSRLTDLDGQRHEVKFDFAFSVLNNLLVNVRERIAVLNAHQPYESNWSAGSLVGATVSYDAPFGITADRWVSSVTAEYVMARYEAPDPAIDPGTTRVDDRWYFRLATAVPAAADWTVIGSVGYTDSGSNLRSYTYDNLDVSLALSYRF
jgi:tetratricopeptide (TPR) repeat protein